MQPIVNVSSVTKSFPGGLVAVNNVDLQVNEGEFVTLLGPSGCGKSTILRMIAGFESPDSGSIFLAGDDVTELPPYRRDVNMVFQDYALFPHMNVRQNVGYGLRVTGVAKEEVSIKVDAALALVELSDKANNQPAQLSGGQRQRVSLARALVRNPKVLLLDEPLSALDANLRDAMQVELKHLHQKLGITFIMVTHDQTEALAMADRIVLMQDGTVAQSGTPAELYDRPATPYVARFIGKSNFVSGVIQATRADSVDVNVDGKILKVDYSGNNIQEGDYVSLCVRPEKSSLATKDSTKGKSNMLPGVVSEILFHGANVRVEVELNDNTPFFVDIQLQSNSHYETVPTIGEAVTVKIPTGNTLLFVTQTG